MPKQDDDPNSEVQEQPEQPEKKVFRQQIAEKNISFWITSLWLFSLVMYTIDYLFTDMEKLHTFENIYVGLNIVDIFTNAGFSLKVFLLTLLTIYIFSFILLKV